MNTTKVTDKPTTLDQYRPQPEQHRDDDLDRESSGMWPLVCLALLVVVFLVFRKPEPTPPPLVGSGAGTGESVQVQPLGIVKRVQYIGGVHVSTQVETTTQTFLLPGVVRVILDSPVELRKRGTEQAWVCVVGTQFCSQALE